MRDSASRIFRVPLTLWTCLYARWAYRAEVRLPFFGEHLTSNDEGPPVPAPAGRTFGLVITCIVASSLTGCATTPSATPVTHSHFVELGDVEGRPLSQAVEDVLVGDRGFSIQRRDQLYATVYYETAWRERDPFPAEEMAGVTEARSRLIIRGPRVSGGRYRAILEAENEVRTDSLPEWHTAPLTVDFRAWIAEIERDFTQHLEFR